MLGAAQPRYQSTVFRFNPTLLSTRNAYTGEIVDPGVPHDPSDAYEARRVKRLVLQEALAEKVPEGVIEFNKKLVGLKDLGTDGVRVLFEDGTETTVDLVVGADGIRSVSMTAAIQPPPSVWSAPVEVF